MTTVHNFPAFQAAVSAFTKYHGSGMSLAVLQTKLTLDALTGMVMYSPVDLGYLRANFQITVGSPARSPVTKKPKRPKGRRKGEKGPRQFPDPIPVAPAIPPFTPSYVSNPVKYAVHVNDGTDRVAGVQMLERTVVDLTRDLQAAVPV